MLGSQTPFLRSAILMAAICLGLVVVAACERASPTSATSPPGLVSSVAVTPATASVAVGQTAQLTATLKDASGNPLSGLVVTWSSSSASVATVSGNGLVIGLAAGSATIGASSEGHSGTAGITVTQSAPGSIYTVFSDGFESGTLAAWDDIYDNGVKAGQAARLTVVPSPTHSGSHALQAYYPANADVGSMSKFFMPGYDTVRARVWFRPGVGWSGSTKLFLLRGSRTDNQWSSFGTAGRCPNGTDFFIAAVAWDVTDGMRFYTYFVGQPQYAGGICYGRTGLEAGINPPATYTASRFPSIDAWHLLEVEVVLNTPGQANRS